MRTYEENGIMFIEEPEISNFLVFSDDHMGCDSIVASDFVSDPRHTRIYAYAMSRERNRELSRIFMERYRGRGCSLVRNASERMELGLV